MRVPDTFALVLLGLAAFRTWKLIGDDTILDRPRDWFLNRIRDVGGKNVGAVYMGTLLECPWCAGFWISLAWWGAWEAWPHTTLIVAVPLVISAVVGFLGTAFHALTD